MNMHLCMCVCVCELCTLKVTQDDQHFNQQQEQQSLPLRAIHSSHSLTHSVTWVLIHHTRGHSLDNKLHVACSSRCSALDSATNAKFIKVVYFVCIIYIGIFQLFLLLLLQP